MKYLVCANSFLFLLLLFGITIPNVRSQGYVNILPDEITRPYYTRRDSVEQSLKKEGLLEWAGRYSIEVGDTWSEQFVWAPSIGFAAYRDTCSNGPRAWVNHGNVSFDSSGLNLFPDRRKGDEFLLDFANNELTFVRWDEQHWLVPKNDLALFAYAINSRSGVEFEVGYIKVADVDKRGRGIPDLPKEYKKLLRLAPITVKVIAIGDQEEKGWFPTMTIDAGRDKNIVEGMNFWLVGNKNIHVRVFVDEVADKTAKVKARMIGSSSNFEKEIIPKIGWRFFSRPTSRAF